MHIRFPLSVAVTSWPISPITAAYKDLHSKISFFSKLFTESPKVTGPNCCVGTVVHPKPYHWHILLILRNEYGCGQNRNFNITGLRVRKNYKLNINYELILSKIL
jgi:hypothetical protein